MTNPIPITISRAAFRAMSDDEYAWPRGAQIMAWRALVRRGLATEETGACEGCDVHEAGTEVPVFRLLIPLARLTVVD